MLAQLLQRDFMLKSTKKLTQTLHEQSEQHRIGDREVFRLMEQHEVTVEDLHRAAAEMKKGKEGRIAPPLPLLQGWHSIVQAMPQDLSGHSEYTSDLLAPATSLSWLSARLRRVSRLRASFLMVFFTVASNRGWLIWRL